MKNYTDLIKVLEDIKALLAHQKKILNVNELCAYTGLSKSKVYKLLMAKSIPVYGNPHVRMKFFLKDEIDEWLTTEKVTSKDFKNSEEAYHEFKKNNVLI